jgi:hypothetical protein
MDESLRLNRIIEIDVALSSIHMCVGFLLQQLRGGIMLIHRSEAALLQPLFVCLLTTDESLEATDNLCFSSLFISLVRRRNLKMIFFISSHFVFSFLIHNVLSKLFCCPLCLVSLLGLGTFWVVHVTLFEQKRFFFRKNTKKKADRGDSFPRPLGS